MKVDTLKDQVSNVGLNYDFFTFNETQIKEMVCPKFPINQIRSFKRSDINPFYKHISRIIELKSKTHEADKNQTV